jgi:gamma-glutamyltranspeptidase/glutathione hydrolase
MDDFSAKAGVPNYYGLLGDEANAIEPGKRPLSSMTPTFVFSDQVQAALGTPGGGRITTMVLLGILDLVDGNPPRSWVSLPRYHHQFMPDEIVFEPGAFTDEEQLKLIQLGHTLKPRDRTYGNMHAVMWHRPSNGVQSASDSRWPSGRALVQ